MNSLKWIHDKQYNLPVYVVDKESALYIAIGVGSAVIVITLFVVVSIIIIR